VELRERAANDPAKAPRAPGGAPLLRLFDGGAATADGLAREKIDRALPARVRDRGEIEGFRHGLQAPGEHTPGKEKPETEPGAAPSRASRRRLLQSRRGLPRIG